jgi:hypothetical protein
MKKRSVAALSVLAWCLGAIGAVALMISTLEPASSVPALLVIACALSALGAVVYGVSRLRITRSTRHRGREARHGRNGRAARMRGPGSGGARVGH